MGLRLKFNLVILAAFAVGFLVAAVVLNRVVNDNARDQVLQNARIMMTAANAIRSYTSNSCAIASNGARRQVRPGNRPGHHAEELQELQDTFGSISGTALNPTNRRCFRIGG